jgi:D-alanyl-D-alanine-carboxypeptidase/D-alanyl-D-alanine-endopeptidase
MRRLTALRILAVFALSAPSAFAQQPTQQAAAVDPRLALSDSAIRAVLKDRVDAKRSSGIAVGILDPDGRTRIFAYGVSGTSRPLDGQSVFEIGSITKTFTATTLADMVVKGEVKLDDPVAKYLPASAHVPSRSGREITLADLATQSSGLPRMPSNFAPKNQANPYADYTEQQAIDFVASYQLPRDVGAKYEYSNLGMGLLGIALTRREGVSYEALVRKHVIDPLGMSETRVTFTPSMRERLALGHDENGAVVSNWDIPGLAGAGALRSTVSDMLKYLQAYVDPSHSKLAPAIELAQTKRYATDNPNLSLGLAWHIVNAPSGSTVIWHNGGTGGYRTFIGFDRARHAGVVVLSNSATSVDDIGLHFVDPRVPLAPAPVKVMHTEITLAPEALDRYVGEYELAPTFHIVVTREGAALFGQPTGQGKSQLFAEKEDGFFLKEVEAQIVFTKDSSGTVTGMVLKQNGQESPGKKIK